PVAYGIDVRWRHRLKIRVADTTPVIRKSASVRVPVRKLAMLVVSGVTARMAGMGGIGGRRQERREKQRQKYCHDTHAIHGDPLALMAGEGVPSPWRRLLAKADCKVPFWKPCA